MTNIIDAMIVYTNIAFQLMLGEASRVSTALKLPIPTPIQAGAVSKWDLTSLKGEVEGTLATSHYEFTFEKGVFIKLRDNAHGMFIRSNTMNNLRNSAVLAQRRPGFKGLPPLPAMAPDAAAVHKHVEAALTAIGINPSALGEGHAKLGRTTPPRYLVSWRQTNAPASFVEVLEENTRIAGIELDADAAIRAGAKKLIVETAAPEANLQLFTNLVRVPCGIETPGEIETRQAVRACFEALEKNLSENPFQALIIEDNFNQSAIVRATLTELLKNFPNTRTAYISIPWENPPAEFPQNLNTQSAKDRRGISMTAITGNVAVRFAHAPAINDAHEQFDAKKFAQMVDQVLPEMRATIHALALEGPATANALFMLPRESAVSGDAFSKAAENRAIPAGARGYARRWTSFIGDEIQTNRPVIVAISGNLPEFDWATANRFGRQIKSYPFQALITMFAFEENRRMETFRRIGDVGLRILKSADEIETFRLWLFSERDERERNGEVIDGYVIKSTGPRLKPAVKETLQEIMFREPQYSNDMKGCIYDPGIAFRMTTTEGSINALVCFDCAQFDWTVRDPKGGLITGGTIDPDPKTMNRLREIALIAFPDFKELRRENNE